MSFLSKAGAHVYAQFGDMELYTGIVIAAVILVWTVGSIANRGIANTAFSRFSVVLTDQFAQPGSSMLKESNSHFFTYSTGRARCAGQLISLKLSPRNDLLSRFLLSWMWPGMYSQDKVVIEVQEAEIDSALTAFICKKFEAEKLTSNLTEVKKFCKTFNGALENGPYANFSSSSLTGFTYICDAGGRAIGPSVFGKGSQVPLTILHNLESIYVSGSSKTVSLQLSSVPRTELEWRDVINYVLSGLLDSLCQVKVSESVRAEVTAQRTEEANKVAREAELAKRKEEIRKQKDEQLKGMSALEREKIEEKKREKEKRKNLKSGRIML